MVVNMTVETKKFLTGIYTVIRIYAYVKPEKIY